MNKFFTKEQVIELSTKYFNGDVLAAEVFTNKYAMKDDKLRYLEDSPTMMHKRMAKEFSKVESKFPNPMSEEEIFNMFDGFKEVIAGGSVMFGVRNPYQKVSLSNCFVIDTVDSYGGICRADERIAQIAKRRGGTGIDITPLRPKGTATKNSALTTDGIVVFMDRFSNTAREVAQCIAKGQKVLTKDGLKNIEDVEAFDMVWTRAGWVNVTGKFQNEKQTYKVTTNGGYEIRTSLDHVFLTYDGNSLVEKKLSEIEEGDTLSLLCGTSNINTKPMVVLKQYDYKNSNNKPNNCILPITLNEELAYLIGYSYGDGYVERNKYGEPRMLSLACAHKYPEIQKKLEDVIEKVFVYKPHSRLGGGLVNKLDIHNKCIIDFLNENGLLKEKSKHIIFPQHILQSPISVVASFISGYFDADGYASGKKKGYTFNSININFLKSIQTILMSVGIISKIHFEDRSEQGWNTLYALIVKGSYSKNLFKQIMFQSVKVNKLEHEGKRDNWLTPYKAKDLRVSHVNYSFIPDNTQNISVSAYNQLPKTDVPEGMLVQDTVESIVEDVIDTTYDLQLETEHLFWCEGFYVHNSGRRGALMISISVHHPEILNFIKAKRELNKVTGANISIRASDEFMKAVKGNKKYNLRWPVDAKEPIISEMVDAKMVWDEIIKSVYLSAEPGILFWDNIIRNSPADSYADLGFKTIGTNPCGELPLPAEDACRLMSINLLSMVDDPFTSKAKFNDDKYKTVIRKSMRLMDDLVELEIEAIDGIINKIKKDPETDSVKSNELEMWTKIKEKCSIGRRTGLGITGLGDCIAMLGSKYGDKASLKIVENIYKTLRDEAYRASVGLAKERGSFSIYDAKLESNNEFIQRLPEDVLKDMKKHGRRNIACLTTAPSGSISVVAQTSSGFEPVFKAKYTRKRKINDNDNEQPDFIDDMGDKWKEYTIEHHGLQKYKSITGKDFKDSPYDGAQANEIDYEMRIKMQATATQYVCHAISSTVNLPNNVDFDIVEKLYIKAWEQGCKGLTIYREDSRQGVLTSAGHTSTRTCDDCDEAGQKFASLIKDGLRPTNIVLSASPTRPKILECEIHRSRVGGGDWLFIVGILNGQPYEIFGGDVKEFSIPYKYKTGWIVKNGKIEGVTQYNLIMGSLEDKNEKFEVKGIAKHFNNYEYGAFTRLCSLTIRHGTPIKYICEQIIKKGVEGDLFSFQRAMSRVLKKYIGDNEKSETECEQCGSEEMVYKAGCPTCMVCGHSKCA